MIVKVTKNTGVGIYDATEGEVIKATGEASVSVLRKLVSYGVAVAIDALPSKYTELANDFTATTIKPPAPKKAAAKKVSKK